MHINTIHIYDAPSAKKNILNEEIIFCNSDKNITKKLS